MSFSSMGGRITRLVPAGVTRSVPVGVTRSVPAGVARSVPAGVTRSVPTGVTRTVPGGVTRSVPGGVTRSKFKEDLFTSVIEHGILHDSSEPSNDNPNVVNALREPFIINQDPGNNSSQSLPQINYHCCYGCGDLLEGIFCHQCTCKLCGNGAHYGYNCPPKVLIIPDPEPFNNQTIKELPPTVQSFDRKSNLVHNSPNVFDPTP
nr:hypothetical protein [Tanacetum cinerariifolium]